MLFNTFINVSVNDDCPYSRACVSNNCVDTCVGLCGINTNCVTTNHTSICQCLPGYAGDPFSSCHLSDLRMYKTNLNDKNV